MLVFVEGGNPKNTEKKPQSMARTNNKLDPGTRQYRNRLELDNSGVFSEYVSATNRKKIVLSYILLYLPG